MKGYKMVEVSEKAFNFCKFSLAGLLWLALILQSHMMVAMTAMILVVSYVEKVQKAPMVRLYNRFFSQPDKDKMILVDENAVAFAHLVGVIVATLGAALIYFDYKLAGWIIIGVLALLKTSGACGYCGAMKLYTCLNHPNGNCCGMGKRLKKDKL